MFQNGWEKTAPTGRDAWDLGLDLIKVYFYFYFFYGESPFGRIFFYLFQVSSKQIQEMCVFKT